MSGVAAVASKSVLTPLERAKLLLSNQDMSRSPPCHTLSGVLRRSVKEDGLLSPWRGNLYVVKRYAPGMALMFTVNNELHKHFVDSDHVFVDVACGSVAGAASLICTFPRDCVRVLIAEDVRTSRKSGNTHRKFSGSFDCFMSTLRNEGIAPLYRGFSIACCGVAIYRGLYFGLYTSLQRQMPFNNFLCNYMLGWVVAVTAGIASYPFDTVRRRMLMSSHSQNTYRNAWDCALKVSQREGPRALMRGAGAGVLRGCVGGGVLAGVDSLTWMHATLFSR